MPKKPIFIDANRVVGVSAQQSCILTALTCYAVHKQLHALRGYILRFRESAVVLNLAVVILFLHQVRMPIAGYLSIIIRISTASTSRAYRVKVRAGRTPEPRCCSCCTFGGQIFCAQRRIAPQLGTNRCTCCLCLHIQRILQNRSRRRLEHCCHFYSAHN